MALVMSVLVQINLSQNKEFSTNIPKRKHVMFQLPVSNFAPALPVQFDSAFQLDYFQFAVHHAVQKPIVLFGDLCNLKFAPSVHSLGRCDVKSCALTRSPSVPMTSSLRRRHLVAARRLRARLRSSFSRSCSRGASSCSLAPAEPAELRDRSVLVDSLPSSSSSVTSSSIGRSDWLASDSAFSCNGGWHSWLDSSASRRSPLE